MEPDADEPAPRLDRLSLVDKAAQVVFAPVAGSPAERPDLDIERTRDLVSRRRVGGLVCFGGSVFETPSLLNALQQVSEVPLLVASDMEAGAGRQVRGATEFPPLMAVGATGSAALAERMGEVTAREAVALGIPWVLAPVLDVNTRPENPIINTRAFSDRADLVATLGKAFLAGLRSGGAIGCAKHFPGHGDSVLDSHLTLPRIDASAAELEARELVPFRAAAQAGADCVMTAHLLVPSIDPDRPASLSPRVTTGLLRERLGYGGGIATDALMMGAIAEKWGPGEAAVLALEAGADVALYPADVEAAIDAIVEAVSTGRLPEASLDRAVSRVFGWKERVGLFRERIAAADEVGEVVGRAAHRAIADEIAQRSLVRVRGDSKSLPVRPGKRERLTLFWVCEKAPASDPTLVRLLREAHPRLEWFEVPIESRVLSLAPLLQEVRPSDRVVVAIDVRVRAFRGMVGLPPEVAVWIEEVARRARRTVVASLGSPYFARQFPSAPCVVCAWSSCEASQRALAAALAGTAGEDDAANWPGTMPVTP